MELPTPGSPAIDAGIDLGSANGFRLPNAPTPTSNSRDRAAGRLTSGRLSTPNNERQKDQGKRQKEW